jgi:hypothetical protein
MATRDDIKNIIAYMALAFPNFHPDVESQLNTVDIFLDLLGDIQTDTLKLAVRAACTEAGRAFAPSVGEIRGIVAELRTKISGVPSAGEAWGEVIGSFERMPGGNMSGGGHTPILDHPLVQKAVHCMGGYGAIGVNFFDNQMANRAHFLRIYADLLDSWKSGATELPELTDYIAGQKETKLLTDEDPMAEERERAFERDDDYTA